MRRKLSASAHVTRTRQVPLANSPAGLLAPLRGAASPPRPPSFPWDFAPTPAPATRAPCAARRQPYLPSLFWRAARGRWVALLGLGHILSCPAALAQPTVSPP